MTVWKCNTCGGTYADTQPDGTLYFHQCPTTPPNAQGVQAPLANLRNENMVLGANGRPTGIAAAGAGVTYVSGAAAAQPASVGAVTVSVTRPIAGL